MDKIIPLRLDEAIASGIDALVARGLFRNRNEALRQGIREMVGKFHNNTHEKRMVASRIIANYLVSKYSHVVSRVMLFGSVARNEDTEWSDVDLVILLQERPDYVMEREIIFDIYSLIDTIDIIISPHFQDEATFQARSRVPNSIEASILENGIILAENKAIKRDARHKRPVDA